MRSSTFRRDPSSLAPQDSLSLARSVHLERVRDYVVIWQVEMAIVSLVGNGPVGIVLSACLQEKGHDVALFGRAGAIHGTFAVEQLEPRRRRPVTFAEHPGLGETEIVFITVKAFAIEAAASQYFSALKSGTVVVILSNGNPEEEIGASARAYEALTFRQGVCLFGAFRQDDGTYCLASESVNCAWGPFGTGTPTPVEQTVIEPSLRWVDDAAALAREKWLFNVVLNSLSAAFDLPRNGDVLQMRDLVEACFTEAYQLGRVLWGAWHEQERDLLQRFLELVAATRDNENSMRRDVRLGRPTESAWLAGRAAGREGFTLLQKLHSAVVHR